MPPRKKTSIPSPIVALAGWAVPGLGHVLIGQRSRGLTIGIAVLALFLLGMLIGGVRVVEAPESNANTSGMQALIMQRPWFVGQVLTGPVAIVAAAISRNGQLPTSHARLNEIGTLYTAVAGMLNLLALIDAAYRSTHDEGARA